MEEAMIWIAIEKNNTKNNGGKAIKLVEVDIEEN